MTEPPVCTSMADRAAYEAALGPCGVCGAPLHVTWVTAPGMPAHHATPDLHSCSNDDCPTVA
ncbi:hypothetical protein [Streptomonospora nanhaiensis]|uniref:hypothetical protein n=1 Tax=Streptomonospora nanhaiensis TaxID=1323731 RepID=UPI001C390713|nr:hypothetical protein [Streptomonospora nanhaiensis]MBV2364241.1 hypothetical protein [Streptomonospora nanhaiensis]